MHEWMMSLEALGRAVPAWLLVITAWTGAIWLVARGADRLLRRRVSAAWRMPLYGLVLVRLLLPVDWASPLSLMSLTAPTPSPATTTSAPTLVELGEVPLLGLPPASSTAAASTTVAVAPVIGAEPSVSRTPRAAWGWGSALMLAWALGTLVIAASVTRGASALRRLVAAATPAPRTLDAGARARVVVHPSAGPLAFGSWRPTIVLPRALLQASEQTQRWVLAHERAHLERRDPALATLTIMVVALAWPVVPVWLAARRIRALLELAADERAVAIEGGDWRDYGRVMIELAAGAPRAPAGALALYGHVRERVEALRERRPRTVVWQAAAGLGLPVAVLACAGTTSSEPTSPDGRSCETIATELAALPVDEPSRYTPALDELVERFEEDSQDGEPTDACRSATRDSLLEAATVWHDRSEKTNDDALRELAAGAYVRFGELFGEDEDAHTVDYYLAELLWARAVHAHEHAPDEAAALFMRSRDAFVVSIDRDPDGQYTEDAAYGQVLATRNAVGELPEPHQTDALEFIPYGDDAEVLSDSYRRYFRAGPGHAGQRGEIAYAWAHLAMQHNHFDEAGEPIELALAAFEELSEPPAEAVFAAEMGLDRLTIVWTRKGLEPSETEAAGAALLAFSERLRTMKLWRHPDALRLHDAVPTLEIGVAWTSGTAAAEAGDYPRCARIYLDAADRFPTHERLGDLLSNAAKCFDSAGDPAAAERTRRRLAHDVH